MAAPHLRLGTRASPLARWQANWVAERLAALGAAVDVVPVSTRGDTTTQATIGQMGGTGLFTKELERALLAEEIDLAVHSLKDLPTGMVEGLVLAAVPPRESVADVLVCSTAGGLADLPPSSVVGTGSARRRSQLLSVRRDLQVRDIRGNVDTRLAKLAAGDYDAIVLAEAGLKRLGLSARISEVLSFEIMLPAVGQGALALQTRRSDAAARSAVAVLDDRASHQSVLAERSLLAELGGGCLAPVGAWARFDAAGRLRLDAAVLSADGARRLDAGEAASPDDAEVLGVEVARRLIEQGAGLLIEAARR